MPAPQKLKQLLQEVADRSLSVDQALQQLRHWPFEDLDYAKLDHHRHLRQGFPEVVFGEGKTPVQITAISRRLYQAAGLVLVTRVSAAAVAALRRARLPVRYEEAGRCAVITAGKPARRRGRVVVVTAGTADIPVAEEARITADLAGADVESIYDVGVAGIHRLLAHHGKLAHANCVVVAAGMDGALASVVGGLAACPVIAVPTSVGYGASFSGVAALLTMLNACSPNVAVVNIDNGFGAGYLAGMIVNLRYAKIDGAGEQAKGDRGSRRAGGPLSTIAYRKSRAT